MTPIRNPVMRHLFNHFYVFCFHLEVEKEDAGNLSLLNNVPIK